ncbi:MAG: hypothetical protein ACI4I1_11035 [Oscillospiraceae bacterium]
MSSDFFKTKSKENDTPVNPICCWCGKEKDRIDKNGSVSSRHIITDYEPCPACNAMFGKGVTFVEVTSEAYRINPKLAPISRDGNGNLTYPTFNAAVVDTEAARRIIPSADFKDGDRCCLYVEDFIRILGVKGAKVMETSISSECPGESLDDILNLSDNAE